MFVFRDNVILNLFLAQEVSRYFGGLYFTRRNYINSKLAVFILEEVENIQGKFHKI